MFGNSDLLNIQESKEFPSRSQKHSTKGIDVFLDRLMKEAAKRKEINNQINEHHRKEMLLNEMRSTCSQPETDTSGTSGTNITAISSRGLSISTSSRHKESQSLSDSFTANISNFGGYNPTILSSSPAKTHEQSFVDSKKQSQPSAFATHDLMPTNHRTVSTRKRETTIRSRKNAVSDIFGEGLDDINY